MADRLLFSKTGRAKYISHLDLMRTFQRAFFRSGIHCTASKRGNEQPVRDPGVRAGGGRIL